MKSTPLFLLCVLLTQRLYAASSSNEASRLDPSGRYAAGELLVKWKNGPDSYAAAVGNLSIGAEAKRNFQQIGWQHVKLPEGMSVRQGMEAYHSLGTVQAVEPNYVAAIKRPAAKAGDSLDPDGERSASAAGAMTETLWSDSSGTESPEPLQAWTDFGASARPQSLAAAASPNVTPNDPQYKSQWNLQLISAPQAWAVTNGSTNVVVAVIDTGVNYEHQDLAANMWRNPGETGLDAKGKDKATNGIDDDGNGYVDDVYGIDTRAHSGDPIDKVAENFHGTGLAGIIGAVGNNGKGIAGINWTVKLMALAIRDGTVAEFLEAADYVIAMKKRGVNVRVISNSYFNEGRHPLADAVNAAGEEGILTVFDADNTGYNNDVFFFDSPKTQWSISVAGSDSSDVLRSYSGYGRSTVDLAAPTEVPSTFEGSTYILSFGGTSGAQPHVAGAAALLAAAKPEATGLEIKAAIKHGVDQRPALKNKTVTGGRLNLAGAIEALTNTSLPAIVVGSLPVSNQTQPDDIIEVLFSRPMDRVSVEAAFQISPSLNGTFQWTNGDRTLQFLHSDPFQTFLFTTNYTCRILGTARDASGQRLDGNFNRTSEGSPADDFLWTFSLPLANDDFTNAVAITGRAGTIAGTTRYATPESDEPLLTTAQLWAFSVWYRWTADATSWVTFDLTLSNNFNTTLGVLAGDRLDQLSVVASNDNYGSKTGSRVSFAADQGTNYSIKVAAKYPGSIIDSIWGNFLLNWYSTPLPGFTGSEFLPLSGSPGSTVTLTGTNFTGATSVFFDVAAASFTNAVNNNLDLTITAVVPPNATSGPITIVTPHGSVTSTNSYEVFPLPALAAALTTDGKLILSWPDTFSGFVLESTPGLTPPNWQPAVEAPKTNNSRWEISTPPSSSERYFRLRKP